MGTLKNNITKLKEDLDDAVQPMSDKFAEALSEEIDLAGGEFEEGAEFEGNIGRTMYDTPTSKDNTVTVLLPSDNIANVPAQSLVRIKSRPIEKGGDNRQYLGAVVEGPFAEPDGLRADAPIVITTTVRGATFMPRYHGRVQVEILGEEVDGVMEPPRFRPLPNSPVFALNEEETRNILGLINDLEIGLAVGFENMAVQIPSKKKSVLPRHVGVLGTTGGGKSTTVSGLIHEFQQKGIFTLVIDTEGEYTEIAYPTEDKTMLRTLKRLGRNPNGVSDLNVLHLVGRETTATAPTKIRKFRLDFSSLSPYAAAEIMDLNDAQTERFFKAYDVAKLVLRDLNIFPLKGDAKQEQIAIETDEFETGYPKLTLSYLIDIANCFLTSLSSSEYEPFNSEFRDEQAKMVIQNRIKAVKTTHENSWKALLGKLWMLKRTSIFDNSKADPILFDKLIKAGRTVIVDLQDMDSTIIKNLVISHILRGIQEQQDLIYEQSTKNNVPLTPIMIIIEEAHEFLSRDKIGKMQNLFEQVARIARRGRKRWLGLMFVTQLPQHLPDEVLGLINNYILHKITDSNVIARLKRSIGGIDEGLWNRLPNLAPGQAIVSMTSMSRPLLVAIHPTPCRLRMVE
ncbi:MAG: ATP-binding protein [Chloroflexota bacterium]|nr:ATP-binding protein [Chloroflexota bacterium]